MVEEWTEVIGHQTTVNGRLPARTVVYDTNIGGSSVYKPTTHLDNAELFARVTSELLARVRTTDLNLAVSAAESKQTASMVAKSLRSVGTWKRQALDLIRVLGKPLSKGSKSASNKWLEATYGWIPLFQDIHGVAVFHRNYMKERQVQAQGYITTRDYIKVGVNPYTSESSWTVTDRLRMSRRLRITDTAAVDLNRLTSLNPLAIAWELVPYSFVVDWVFDIGGYLQNLETACGAGYQVVSGFNAFTSRVVSSTHVTRGPSAPAAVTQLYGNGAYRATWKDRQVANSLPLPQPPSFVVNLGARRILSAAALVRQQLRF
jgi:hypothetical protein